MEQSSRKISYPQEVVNGNFVYPLPPNTTIVATQTGDIQVITSEGKFFSYPIPEGFKYALTMVKAESKTETGEAETGERFFCKIPDGMNAIINDFGVLVMVDQDLKFSSIQPREGESFMLRGQDVFISRLEASEEGKEA